MTPYEELSLTIAQLTLVVTVVTAVAALWLSYLGIRFTAPPKLAISYKGEELTGRTLYLPGEEVELAFLVENRGRWLVKPAARDVKVYVNLDSSFEPRRLRFGSVLERSTEEIRRGVRNSKYLVAHGIQLAYGEPGEEVVARVVMPKESGEYDVWLSAFERDSGQGVHSFKIRVV